MAEARDHKSIRHVVHHRDRSAKLLWSLEDILFTRGLLALRSPKILLDDREPTPVIDRDHSLEGDQAHRMKPGATFVGRGLDCVRSHHTRIDQRAPQFLGEGHIVVSAERRLLGAHRKEKKPMRSRLKCRSIQSRVTSRRD